MVSDEFMEEREKILQLHEREMGDLKDILFTMQVRMCPSLMSPILLALACWVDGRDSMGTWRQRRQTTSTRSATRSAPAASRVRLPLPLAPHPAPHSLPPLISPMSEPLAPTHPLIPMRAIIVCPILMLRFALPIAFVFLRPRAPHVSQVDTQGDPRVNGGGLVGHVPTNPQDLRAQHRRQASTLPHGV